MKKKKGQKKTEESAARDRKLLIKCVSISATFVICWTPAMLMILISMITRTPFPATLEALFTLLASMSSTANPILIILFDASLKYDVYNMFGLTRLLSRKPSSNLQSKTSKIINLPHLSKKSSPILGSGLSAGNKNRATDPGVIVGKTQGGSRASVL